MIVTTDKPLILEKTWLPKIRGRSIYRVKGNTVVRLRGAYLTVLEDGYLTDCMSWPFIRLVKIIFPSWFKKEKISKYTLAAVVHDHLLQTTNMPKWQVDNIFYLALRSNSVSALEAFIFKMAVRSKRTRF